MERMVEQQQLEAEQLLEEGILETVGILEEEVLEVGEILEERCLEEGGSPGRCECVCEYERDEGAAGTLTYLPQLRAQVRG